MLIIRRNTLSAGLQHLNWKFNVFVHREPTFTLLLLWRVIWAARYFWWPLLIGVIKTWDPLPIPFHSVPIISGPTFNGIGKNRCPIDRHQHDLMPIFGCVPSCNNYAHSPQQISAESSVRFIPMLACKNIRFSTLFAAGDVSHGGTSATQRQKFHTDDVKYVQNPVRSPDWSTQ